MRQAAGLLVLGGLIAAACLTLFSGNAPTSPPAVHAETSTTTTTAEDGRQLYINTCASCHGSQGEGSAAAPPLTGAGAAGLDFYMRTGRMPLSRLDTPPWQQPPVLTPAQIAAITEYATGADGFSNGPPIPPVVTDATLTQRGWQLYINNCAACHGANGAGGAVGGGVTAPDLTTVDALTVAEAMLIGPGAMPRFAMPQQDVNAIATYVTQLATQPSPGGIPIAGSGPVPEGFIAAIAGLGVLLLTVRWIGRREKEPRAKEPNGE